VEERPVLIDLSQGNPTWSILQPHTQRFRGEKSKGVFRKTPKAIEIDLIHLNRGVRGLEQPQD
jgi:hypothetical protein